MRCLESLRVELDSPAPGRSVHDGVDRERDQCRAVTVDVVPGVLREDVDGTEPVSPLSLPLEPRGVYFLG